MKAHLLLFIQILFFSTASAQIINFPDANFKARLLQASPSNNTASTQTPNVNGYVSSYNTIDTNGDGEIEVSEASSIKFIAVTQSFISNLEGINYFSNLLLLNCSNNPLTSLNVSSLTNLQFLYCQNNQLANLNVSGLTNLTNLTCSANQLNNLDINGLTNLSHLNFSSNQLTSIDVSGLTNLQILSCTYNQLTSIDVSGLTNLQILYCDHNQLTSIDVSGLTNLQRLSCTYNQLTSIDLSGLTNLQRLYCDFNQLNSLNVSGLTSLQQLLCNNNQLNNLNVSGLTSLQQLLCNNNQLSIIDVSDLSDLSVLNCSNNQLESLFIKNNNTSWSFLSFENNPNLHYICTDDQDVELVQQKINQYGYASTCAVNSYCSFTPGGVFYTIQGNNKYDGNTNGCDVSDAFYPNLKYSITNGTETGNLISNASGNYSIPVVSGTHTLTPQLENSTYFTVSPVSTTVSFPASTSPYIQDFCITPNGVHHDLEVVIISIDAARPGFDATYKIKYKNKGTVSETATLVFNFDEAVLDFVTASLVPTAVSAGSLSWTIGAIAPFQSGEFFVTFNVNSPVETPAVNDGDLLSYSATLNGLNTDETPEDNMFTLQQTVVNSYDPNDKTCLEGTTINPTMIGEYVHYQIRFENTGTFPAQNIVVKDLIDTAVFDVSTLQMTDASHPCVTRITNPNQVEFIFENINLPFDDANNDGYLVFKIKTKSALVTGSTISNLANIYFDYNFPITTNTATSTFQTLQNDGFELDDYLMISPNPVDDFLTLSTQKDAEMFSVSIYNLLGQQIQTLIHPTKTLDVSSLQTGSYIIKVTTENGVSSGKFIKE